MDQTPFSRADVDPARSFDLAADAYARARPGYPDEAVRWLVDGDARDVLEVAAGTGKLTAGLRAAGHRVVATDVSATMLARLAATVPDTRVAAGAAEQLPVRSRSADVVVGAQAFHWFDLARALPEAARVLRPGGVLALVWNARDDRIPWVRRVGEHLGRTGPDAAVLEAVGSSGLFAPLESARFRFWQPLNRDSLRDLAASQSRIALLSDTERRRVLAALDALYEEYGRGPDGMLLPYITYCYRARVLPRPDPEPAAGREPWRQPGPDDLDPDALLIDFR